MLCVLAVSGIWPERFVAGVLYAGYLDHAVLRRCVGFTIGL